MSSDEEVEIKIKEWYVAAGWSMNNDVTSCAICRNNIMDICVQCQKGNIYTDNGCEIALGECTHAFHYHCISKWLRTRPLCPLDSKNWVYVKKED